MEDFIIARADEPKQQSGLQAEWIDRLPSFSKTSDSSLSLAFAANDNQAPVKEKSQVSSKDAADALDKELKDFANSKIADPSRDMQKFQKAVGKFCDASDKESAMDDLGETWSKINSLLDVKAEALFAARKQEAANTPGRKELEASVKDKNYQFSDKMLNLPFDESMRIEDLMMWKEGETKEQHNERILKGLASNKPMLEAYKAIGAAQDKVEANKGPREKQLDRLSEQVDEDAKIMKAEMEKAYLRSTIKN